MCNTRIEAPDRFSMYLVSSSTGERAQYRTQSLEFQLSWALRTVFLMVLGNMKYAIKNLVFEVNQPEFPLSYFLNYLGSLSIPQFSQM